MESIEIFNNFAEEYDKWFDINKYAYISEINAVKKVIPKKGIGIEIGAGTGKFAIPLNVKIGIEPSISMGKIAKNRGVEIISAVAENLPIKKSFFDFALLITTICFVKDPDKTISEIKRIIKPGGVIIAGFIDKESFLGKIYQKRKESSKFYKYAKFFSTEEILELLKKHGFENFKIFQTIFKNLNEINSIEPVLPGYGKGAFVVISGKNFNLSPK